MVQVTKRERAFRPIQWSMCFSFRCLEGHACAASGPLHLTWSILKGHCLQVWDSVVWLSSRKRLAFRSNLPSIVLRIANASARNSNWMQLEQFTVFWWASLYILLYRCIFDVWNQLHYGSTVMVYLEVSPVVKWGSTPMRSSRSWWKTLVALWWWRKPARLLMFGGRVMRGNLDHREPQYHEAGNASSIVNDFMRLVLWPISHVVIHQFALTNQRPCACHIAH